MRRTLLSLVSVVILLLTTAPAALAQDAPRVPVGGNADVSNGNECAPDTPAQFFLAVEGADPVALGSVQTDSAGHVEVSLDIPADSPLGPASVLVDCGIAGSVLVYEIELVDESGFGWPGLFPLALGIVILCLAGLLVIRLRRSGSEDSSESAGSSAPSRIGALFARFSRKTESESEADEGTAMPDRLSRLKRRHVEKAEDEGSEVDESVDAEDGVEPAATETSDVVPASDEALEPEHGDADAPAFVGSAAAVETEDADAVAAFGAMTTDDSPNAASADDHDESDDGAEYWFWDVETSRGPARRLACITETTFHLDEVPVSAFPTLLERIQDEGPEAVLAKAFLSVRLDAVQAVHRRHNEIRISSVGPNGPEAKTIDLGSEVEGVVGLLSHRFVIHDVTPAPAG